MRSKSHYSSAQYEGRQGPPVVIPQLNPGDCVFIKSERSKSHARDKFVVVSVDNQKKEASVQKFGQTQNKKNLLTVKLSNLFLSSPTEQSLPLPILKPVPPSILKPPPPPTFPKNLKIAKENLPRPFAAKSSFPPPFQSSIPQGNCFFCKKYNRISPHSSKSCQFLSSSNPLTLYNAARKFQYPNESDSSDSEEDLDPQIPPAGPPLDGPPFPPPPPHPPDQYPETRIILHPMDLPPGTLEVTPLRPFRTPPQSPPEAQNQGSPRPSRPIPGRNIRVHNVHGLAFKDAFVKPMAKSLLKKHTRWANIWFDNSPKDTSFNFIQLKGEYI